jgi:hypothetical protein
MERLASGTGNLEGAEYPIRCNYTVTKLDDRTMELYCVFSVVDQTHVPYSKKFANISGSSFTRFEGTRADGRPILAEQLEVKRSQNSHHLQRMWFSAKKVT